MRDPTGSQLYDDTHADQAQQRERRGSKGFCADGQTWQAPETDTVGESKHLVWSLSAHHRQSGSLSVNANTDEMIGTHLFDVTCLVFNLVVERMRPFVVYPTGTGSIGDQDHFPNEIFAILIL